jgi:hypothetical protein
MMSGLLTDTDVLNAWILFLRLWKLMTRFVTVLFGGFRSCGVVASGLLEAGAGFLFGVEVLCGLKGGEWGGCGRSVQGTA